MSEGAYVADGLAVVAAPPERRLRRAAVRAGQARALLLPHAHTIRYTECKLTRSIHDKLARSIESNRSSKSKNSWLSELIVYVLLFGTLLIIIITDYYIYDVMLWFSRDRRCMYHIM